jgi:hypothetical protein
MVVFLAAAVGFHQRDEQPEKVPLAPGLITESPDTQAHPVEPTVGSVHADLGPPVASQVTFVGAPMLRVREPLCTGQGSDGYRVHVVLAQTPQRPVSAKLRERLPGLLLEMDNLLAQSAWHQSAPISRIRFATDSGAKGCRVLMRELALPSGASADGVDDVQAAVMADADLSTLVQQGISRLLVISTARSVQGYCGLAFLSNEKDSPLTWLAQVNCVDSETMLHELLHTLGAVDPQSVHASAHGHCLVGGDIMCYDDSPSGTQAMSAWHCANDFSTVDCLGSMYFNLNGPIQSRTGGQVLNTAESAFLERTGIRAAAPSRLAMERSQKVSKRTPSLRVAVSLDGEVSGRVQLSLGSCSTNRTLRAGFTGTITVRSTCLKPGKTQAHISLNTSAQEFRTRTVKLIWVR